MVPLCSCIDKLCLIFNAVLIFSMASLSARFAIFLTCNFEGSLWSMPITGCARVCARVCVRMCVCVCVCAKAEDPFMLNLCVCVWTVLLAQRSALLQHGKGRMKQVYY